VSSTAAPRRAPRLTTAMRQREQVTPLELATPGMLAGLIAYEALRCADARDRVRHRVVRQNVSA
jgi:hypothetical protein